MSSTSSSENWQIQRLASSQAQGLVRKNPIIALSAIGDVHTLSTSFFEQFASISAIGENVAGTSATRTYTIEFRHSTDNTTWTAWTLWTLVNAQAITYDPNLRNYFQHRVTRTGSDATGLLVWESLAVTYTYLSSAISGWGMFTRRGLRAEIKLFLQAAIQSLSIQSGGRDRFQVLPIENHKASNANNNTILIANLDIGGEPLKATRNYSISCKLFVKMRGSSRGNDQGYSDEMNQMAGIVLEAFRKHTWTEQLYTLTFKGVDFVGVQLSRINGTDTDTGCGEFDIVDNGEIYFEKTDTTYNEMTLKFTIFAVNN